MYCRNCGKEINEETRFCPACGSKPYVENKESYGSTYDDLFTTSSEATEVEDKPAKCWSVFAKVGKILGIISIAIAIIPLLYGLVVGVHGIVFSCLGRKAIDDEAINNRNIGLKLSIAGTVISFFSFILYVVLTGVFGGLAAAGFFEEFLGYIQGLA